MQPSENFPILATVGRCLGDLDPVYSPSLIFSHLLQFLNHAKLPLILQPLHFLFLLTGRYSAHPHMTSFASSHRAQLQCHLLIIDTLCCRVALYCITIFTPFRARITIKNHLVLVFLVCLLSVSLTWSPRAMSVLLHSSLLHPQHQEQGLAAGMCARNICCSGE